MHKITEQAPIDPDERRDDSMVSGEAASVKAPQVCR